MTKTELTKTQEAKSIIVGSYILYMINSLLERNEHNNLTTIRLKQLLLAKTRIAKYKPYVVMSNKAWESVIEEFKDDNMHLVIFDAVEDLAFTHEDSMTKMFGINFLPYATSFAYKQTRDGVDNSLLKESRIITKALKKAVEKVVFDNKGNL